MLLNVARTGQSALHLQCEMDTKQVFKKRRIFVQPVLLFLGLLSTNKQGKLHLLKTLHNLCVCI